MRLVPDQLNISCAQFPVTVHSIVPPHRKNSEQPPNTFRAKCPMIVPLSQLTTASRSEAFSGSLSHTDSLTAAPILLYIRGSLKYNNSFRNPLPWQLLSPYVLPPAQACLSLRPCATRKPITLLQTLCCKIFVLNIFIGPSTLQKSFNTKILPTKISYNKNFPIYGRFINLYVCLVSSPHGC